MARKNVIIVVLALLLILSVFSSLHIYQQQQRVIDTQEDIIEQLTSVRSAGRAAIDAKQTFINVSEGVSCANIVAVRTDTQFGVLGTVHVEIKNGTGNVLVNTNPFTDLTTQYSVREAVKVAEDYTNRDVTTKDISIYFDINGTLIGGPSAGAAIAAAAIAAMEGKTLKPDVVITGTIEKGGYIGQVGAVLEKAEAAEKNGMNLFLVPKGYKKLTYYEQKTKEYDIFGFTFVRSYYVQKEIDLGEHMKGKMDVEEVSTIEDVVAYMIL